MDNLINAIGAMAEMWNIAYQSFINQGLTAEEALEHTKALMKIVIKEDK